MEENKALTDAETQNENGTENKKKERKKRFRTFFRDFKEFIAKGNIINLAVAVVIGAAFGAVVTALVNDFVMPLIALVVGKGGLEELKWTIRAADELGEGGIYILWGDFLQKLIDFLLIAFCIFLTLRLLINAQKGITKTQKKWLKKLKKNPELAENPPEEIKEELAEAVQASEEPPKIESTEDILKDIRNLLTAFAAQNQKGDSNEEIPTNKA